MIKQELKKALNNHRLPKEEGQIYTFIRGVKTFVNPGDVIIDNETFTQVLEARQTLNNLIDIANVYLIALLDKIGVADNKLIDGNNIDVLDKSIKELQSVIMLNPKKDYIHLQKDHSGIVANVSKINAGDGILDSNIDLQTDILKGYTKVVDNKLVIDVDLKNKYINTLGIKERG